MAKAAPSARVVVMDWDETITTKDTTELVAQTAYRHKTGLTDFSHYSKIYLDAYEEYLAKWLERKTIDEEIAYQKGMRDVEMSLISAIENDGLFKGLTRCDFVQSALGVEIKDGFTDFVSKAQKLHALLYILSVNWSRTLIETALLQAGVSGINVLANEPEFYQCKATGYFSKDTDIRTGYDKLVELEKIRNDHPDRSVLFVGDSSGDVLPIVKADTGVIIEGGRARKYIDALGLPVREVDDSLEEGIYEGNWNELLQHW